MTVRRDLQKLSAKGLVRLLHGVAFCEKTEDGSAYDLLQELGVNAREKDMIGRRATAMIAEGDSVFIDCGSTASAMMRHLPSNMRITLACSTLNVVVEAQKKKVERLIFTGGYYHEGTETFESPEAVRLLSGIRTGKAFITASGVSMELGLTCMEQYETEIKRVAMENALTKILLVDSSKFSRVSPAFFGTWKSIDTVITDDGVPGKWKDYFKQNGIRLVIAGDETEE